MSPEESKELAAKYRSLAEFFAAKAEGKSLQLSWTKFSEGNGITVWETTEYFPTPDSDLSRWRVKPEPRRMWMSRVEALGCSHSFDETEAKEWKRQGMPVTEWTEVQP